MARTPRFKNKIVVANVIDALRPALRELHTKRHGAVTRRHWAVTKRHWAAPQKTLVCNRYWGAPQKTLGCTKKHWAVPHWKHWQLSREGKQAHLTSMLCSWGKDQGSCKQGALAALLAPPSHPPTHTHTPHTHPPTHTAPPAHPGWGHAPGTEHACAATLRPRTAPQTQSLRDRRRARLPRLPLPLPAVSCQFLGALSAARPWAAWHPSE